MTPAPSNPPARIHHFADAAQWQAQQGGGRYAPPGWEREGFIHCATPAQVPGVVARHLRGRKGLLIVTLDAATLGDALRYEWSAASADWYPHLFAPIDVRAVVAVEDFATDDGFPEEHQR